MTKITKKLIAVISLLLLVSVLFCSCTKEQVLSALAIDLDTYDPAIEMAADVLGKTISKENLTSGDYTYSVYSDDTAVIVKYNGKDAVLEIPGEIDGYTVIALENKSLFKNNNITELILPDSLEVVGNFAAMYCEKLEKVTFGKNIKNIGVSAFESEGDDTSSTSKGSLETLVFNGAPEIIREEAFYYNHKLAEIVLPDGVKTIENWAFAKCFSADKIIIGEGNEFIGDHAFLKCNAAKTIVIPNSCKTVSTSAFYQCSSATSLTIGNSVEIFEKGAFEECSSLESVVIPDSVKTIEPYAFYNCTSLKEVTAGNNIDTIEKEIFKGTDGLTVKAPEDSVMSEYAKDNKINVVKR